MLTEYGPLYVHSWLAESSWSCQAQRVGERDADISFMQDRMQMADVSERGSLGPSVSLQASCSGPLTIAMLLPFLSAQSLPPLGSSRRAP